MQVAIAGSTGFIGSALARHLSGRGHRIRPLLRPGAPPHDDGIRWDPAGGVVQTELLEGVDAVVNVAGESIGAARWSDAFMERMRSSRVRSAATLASAIASLDRKPRVFVSMSASGYYGEQGEDEITEESPPGDGKLSRLCVAWEEAAQGAGCRTAVARTGIVLEDHGGLLAKMLLPFRLGVGARLGDGRQWMPWITLGDGVRALEWLIERDDADGAFNVCSPQPVRNATFTKELASALHRPAWFAIPRFALAAAFTQDAAREAFLVSQRMVPSRLLAAGFELEHPEIRDAIRSIL